MRILFIDRSTKLGTVNDLSTRARGGMVTSLFKISDYLAEQGHDVEVLSDIGTPGYTREGVHWTHQADGEYDFLICNRGTGDGYPMISARRRVLWTHDLPHSGFIPEPKTIRAFCCTVFMSRYAERVWRAFYKDIGRSVTITNGVDKALFRPQAEAQRGVMIYASAPNRGLQRLPLIADAISTRVKFPTHLAAYSNLAALHPNEVGDGDDFDYESLRGQVTINDPVPQPQLARLLGQAQLMILPTGYPEICSNVVLQALACGTPIITTGNLGATPEWVRHGVNGMLTEYHPHDYMIHTVEIVRAAVRVFEDERLYRRLREGALRTKIPSWQEIGNQWLRMLNRFS